MIHLSKNVVWQQVREYMKEKLRPFVEISSYLTWLIGTKQEAFDDVIATVENFAPVSRFRVDL